MFEGGFIGTAVIVLVAILAVIVSWLAARAQGAAAASAQIEEAQRRLSAAEAHSAASDARAQELRAQLAAAQAELSRLRQDLTASEQERVAADTRAEEVERHAEEQRRLLEDARLRLGETFKSLASDVLAGSSTHFLQLAEEKFKTLREEASGDLEVRREQIGSLVQPLLQSIDAYRAAAQEMEQRRDREMGSVGEQLRQVALAQQTLRTETARLVTALRSPHVRGRWGEIALRRTAELAGMSQHCDFTDQAHIAIEDGRLRPDMVVHLPAGREVIVDSKVPLSAYLEALEAPDDTTRVSALTRHAAQVRKHVMQLASKSYAEQLNGSAEFVVLFIPNDSFLAAAAERDPDLVEWALAQHVVLATPASFIALLRAIAYGWRQEKVAENAQRISDVGRQLSERMAVLVDHLSKMGDGIRRSVKSYNQAVASLESRVLPTARKFEELEVGAKREIPSLSPIEQDVRQVVQPRLELE